MTKKERSQFNVENALFVDRFAKNFADEVEKQKMIIRSIGDRRWVQCTIFCHLKASDERSMSSGTNTENLLETY